MKRAGVKMGLGTDLLGALHVRQSKEFELRSQRASGDRHPARACKVNAD